MDKAAKVTITKKRKLDSDDEQTPQKVPRILHVIRKREQINQSLIDRKQFHLVPSLAKIRIRDVNFDQDRAEIFARALKSTTHLREVILHNNDLTSSGLVPIIEALATQTNLTQLSITANHVHDQDAKAVCKLLTNKFLTYLDLSDNDIELEEEWFIQSLASSSLEELDLSDNLIGREGEKNLAEAIGHNSSLKRLSLADNPMPCTLIGDSLAKNNSLQFLDLEKTALSKAGWTSIATSLKTNKSLVVLNMNDANVTNDDLLALIEGVKLHPKLIFISLIGTQISKHILQEFSDYLYEKQHFKQLKKEISEEAFLIKKCYEYDYGSSIETSMSDSEDEVAYSHNEFITMNRVPPVRYNKFTFPLYNEDSPEDALHVARRFPEAMNEISFDQQISNSLVEAKKEFQKNAEEALAALETSKNNAECTNEELRASFESLQTEEKELKAQLARIKTRLKEMKNESTLKQEALIFYEINSNRLQMKFSAARTNVEDSKNELDQYEERVKKFREKMKNLTWTTNDLLEFLEITCASKETMAAIEDNQIDGDILKTLPTVDLVKTLKMTFKDAKRLQTYMRLIDSGKDVFNPCTGVLSWRSKDVSEWLKQHNLAKLATKFQRQTVRSRV